MTGQGGKSGSGFFDKANGGNIQEDFRLLEEGILLFKQEKVCLVEG